MKVLYIQDLVRSFTIFCIVLLISLPVAVSAKVELPKLVDVIIEEGEFFKGEYADFAINVKASNVSICIPRLFY